MATLRNNFNGGSNGTEITTGNSGGVSGDAVQHIVGAPTFSNTQAHSGTLSCATVASDFSGVGFELAGATFWVRFYAYLTQHVAGSLLRLWDNVDASGAYQGGIETKANGFLDLVCGGATVNVAGAAVTLNQWVRVEAMFSTTNGASAQLYNSSDSGTVSASASTASDLGGTCRTQEILRPSDVTVVQYFDDFAVSTDGPLGPAVDPAPRPTLVAATAVHRASRW
ncbi:hypothetical protein FXF51_06190 [Nonomuraea sp. PA05]|uniref:hypothetical protein n=1 Tax=Nonomuraea sp. PA05 TaxID=2604466 RepID=UPI0011DA66A8|nr:hypothetical protein [Nonomuraea sp. PA05]TYB69750.1 hypothetical protein FXF51_06190 [Nonomuraea sp. PA05]